MDTEADFGTTVTEFRITNEDECLHYCLHKVNTVDTFSELFKSEQKLNFVVTSS